jgi:hypothetical protein
MSHDVERRAQALVNTSVQDALSGAWGASIAVLDRAVQLEMQRSEPRMSLIRGLRAERAKRVREQAAAPKDVA